MKYLAFSLAISVALCAGRADSQTFKTLLSFTGTGGAASGENPYGSLAASGSTLYGMTYSGGTGGIGNIFSVGADGTHYKNLVSFTGFGGVASGYNPWGSLTLSGTTLYGMTSLGGVNRRGNIFSVSTTGSNFQNLVSFSGTTSGAIGNSPLGNLTLDGTTLYGMTFEGGDGFHGNVFSSGTDGTNYRNLISFTGSSGTANGESPLGSLTLDGSILFGMTETTGADGFGTVFSVGTGGTSFQTLISFTGTNGAATGQFPTGSLTLDGTTLYGMTIVGGAYGNGNVFSVGTDGTSFLNLLSFTGSGGSVSGANPRGSLTLTGTTLYGLTQSGGTNGFGNIFSIGIDGSGYRNLYSFAGGNDGMYPQGDLTVSGGTLFGMTLEGGANNDGTVFAFAMPTPEPGTLALVGCGAAALVAYRWRRMQPRRRN